MSESTPENASVAGVLTEGTLIGGKYRLVKELGVGGMGIVWSAMHLTLGHQVAIKFLLSSIMASEEARSRFDREARLAARLGEASRHITRVIDHGVTEERVPYLVMELLRGESLSARLKRDRRLPLVLAAQIVQQLARALHVAHSAGVIHRDLKPANIYLCTPEHGDEVDVKLLDFGVAKATADGSEGTFGGVETTRRGQVLGTPSYMSPEQILCDRPVDLRADLWAVSAIAYRMVVGRSPFGSGPLQEIGIRVMSVEPLPPSIIWPDLPREFDNWVERGLAKNPDVRFQNARELADFLAAVAGLHATKTASSAAAVQQEILEGKEDTPRSDRTVNERPLRPQAPRAGRRRRNAAIASIVLAAVAVFALHASSRRTQRPKPLAVAASHVQMATPAPTAAPAPSPIVTVVTMPATVDPPTPRPTVAAKPSTAIATPSIPGPKPTKTEGSGWDNKKEL